IGECRQNNDGDVTVGGGKRMSINIDKIKGVNFAIKKSCTQQRSTTEENDAHEEKELKCA
ncbi:MAG TPA: hypothetical protein DCO65_08100, partial [Spartobacteria bacterium]|nr:hypothetical protein [Spartobacteria bacterium]